MVEAGVNRCQYCGSPLNGSRFCPNCGAPQAPQAPVRPTVRFCPNCGNQNPVTNGFCSRCGTNFQAPSAPPLSQAPPSPTVTTVPAPKSTHPVANFFVAVLTIMFVGALVMGIFWAGGVFDPAPVGGTNTSEDTTTGVTIGEGDYSWKFGKNTYRMDINISAALVEQYRNNKIQRYGTSYSEMVKMCDAYVTSTDGVIQNVALQLSNFSADFSKVDQAQFVLSFVQYIEYMEDEISSSADEYWRFPVETLYDKMGDCEDKAFLYASLMEAMGFDAVILIFEGHAATGIAVNGASGTFYNFEGSKYFYCETTAVGWKIGQIPDAYGSAYIGQVD